jgi:hypothetical protein
VQIDAENNHCVETATLALGSEKGHILGMAKTSLQSSVTVRDTKTGKFVTVRGAGSLKDSDFKVKKAVDLTKPIASQMLSRKG